MKPTILEEIFALKKLRVDAAKKDGDVAYLREQAISARTNSTPFRLSAALRSPGANIIAEIKRASPSKGDLNADVDVADTAKAYENAGASAISVLTEEDCFKGSLSDLKVARAESSLPILQKDFVFDQYQIYQAAAAGADAILLIVAMLDDDSLAALYQTSRELTLDVLVEVHNAEEMARAIDLGADIIGINNRDLHTFEVSLDISRELIRSIPPGILSVSESGLRNHNEITELKGAGFNGFLIGETLMRSGDVKNELRGLTGNG